MFKKKLLNLISDRSYVTSRDLAGDDRGHLECPESPKDFKRGALVLRLFLLGMPTSTSVYSNGLEMELYDAATSCPDCNAMKSKGHP